MQYDYIVRKADPKQGVLGLIYRSEGRPDFFRNVATRDFSASSIQAIVNQNALLAREFWEAHEAAPETGEVSEGATGSGTAELIVQQEPPVFDEAFQKLERTENFDSATATRTYSWNIISLTDEEQELYRQSIKGPEAQAKAQQIVLREQIAAKIDTLSDEDKATFAYLYDAWSGDGVALKTNDIVRVKDVPYRVLQDHTTQSDWNPADASSLFTPLRVTSGDTPDEWVQPTNAEDAYNTGDRVTFEGEVYESLIDANTFSPAVYPAGWQLIV